MSARNATGEDRGDGGRERVPEERAASRPMDTVSSAFSSCFYQSFVVRLHMQCYSSGYCPNTTVLNMLYLVSFFIWMRCRKQRMKETRVCSVIC